MPVPTRVLLKGRLPVHQSGPWGQGGTHGQQPIQVPRYGHWALAQGARDLIPHGAVPGSH